MKQVRRLAGRPVTKVQQMRKPARLPAMAMQLLALDVGPVTETFRNLWVPNEGGDGTSLMAWLGLGDDRNLLVTWQEAGISEGDGTSQVTINK